MYGLNFLLKQNKIDSLLAWDPTPGNLQYALTQGSQLSKGSIAKIQLCTVTSWACICDLDLDGLAFIVDLNALITFSRHVLSIDGSNELIFPWDKPAASRIAAPFGIV